jgi:hypothetical protein
MECENYALHKFEWNNALRSGIILKRPRAWLMATVASSSPSTSLPGGKQQHVAQRTDEPRGTFEGFGAKGKNPGGTLQ